MLFAKVEEKGVKSIKRVLDQFCEESGQVISADKSRIYFSPNISSNLKDSICDTLGIQATSCLGKYFGFPLKHKGVGRKQFNFVVERIIAKL